MIGIDTREETVEGTSVLRVLLDWPQKANALNESRVEALHAVMDAAGRKSVGVIVFTTRLRTFCSGFDMTGLADETDASLLLRFCRLELLLHKIHSASSLTVAYVTGPAVGAGADLVIACNQRYATSEAYLAFPGPAFGAILGTGRLATAVSRHNAIDAGLLDQRIDIARGSSLGIWRPVQDDAAFETALRRTCQTLSQRSVTTVSQYLTEVGYPDRGNDYLGALVRSLAKPGLKERIQNYLDTRTTDPTSRDWGGDGVAARGSTI